MTHPFRLAAVATAVALAFAPLGSSIASPVAPANAHADHAVPQTTPAPVHKALLAIERFPEHLLPLNHFDNVPSEPGQLRRRHRLAAAVDGEASTAPT
jgi:hypothetical protein